MVYLTPLLLFTLGVFGGASIETGKTDPVVQLLAVYGYIERHLDSVRMLAAAPVPSREELKPLTDGKYSDKPTCVRWTIIPHIQAILLLEKMLVYTHECVNSVFSTDAYATDTSEKVASDCLYAIQKRSSSLFVDMKQTETDISRLRNKHNLYHCCV